MVGFENSELTKEGFLKLYKIEAGREDLDMNDIITRLGNLGFNKSLKIDQVNQINFKIFENTDKIF